MIPIYGRERFFQVKKIYEDGKPVEFAGGNYVVVEIEYDTRSETGNFSVQEVKVATLSSKDSSVRDAVLNNR